MGAFLPPSQSARARNGPITWVLQQALFSAQFAGEDAEEFAGFFDFEEVAGGNWFQALTEVEVLIANSHGTEAILNRFGRLSEVQDGGDEHSMSGHRIERAQGSFGGA